MSSDGPVPDGQGSNGGRGSSGRFSHGRGRGRGGRWRTAPSPPPVPLPVVSTFKGQDASLNGRIFDLVSERNSKMYTETTKEIVGWAGREFTKNTGVFTSAIDNLVLVPMPDPPDPVDPTNLKQETQETDFLSRL